MRVALVFVLLFATVFCRPARKVSDSSESSEEVKRWPAVSEFRQKTSMVSQNRATPLQNVAAADESTETKKDEQQVAAQATEEVKSDMKDTFSSDTASIDSTGSEGSDDDDDDIDESESEEDEDDSNSSDVQKPSTPAPTTASSNVFTEEPVAETTVEPILPTIVTDNGRGDSMGGYPDDYKSIIYIEDKSYHKVPGPYKSYEYIDTGKKTGYDINHGNEVEKSMQMYKNLQVQSDLLEEDTSTPEMENQGMDISSSTSQDQGPLPEEGDSMGNSESGSSSNPDEEEEEESTSSVSDSSSHNSEPEESSEESTADSNSDESNSTQSNSDEDGAGLDKTTDVPAVITAK